ncbi:MAG: hypothetical protein ACQEW2_02140 [Bacillota bacterium]|uniref:hypothetical protein n=1 Tax=Cytobacillus firmus TaxID=1399 RepID=UPI0018CFAC1F|nr:hypothetical protein [Cytobacillus firmus]MBG9603926.1 hypothetical protein [Cytobacillus firmus]MBG9656095.1 hypothetical protein [Cytobacillus firmus]MED1907824.1 hypothetical protein [Cytobacillus firmus]
MKLKIVLVLLIAIITGCSNAANSNTKSSQDELNQFYEDSDQMISAIEKAHSESRDLTSEEDEKFREYVTYYGSESKFKESAGANESLISSNIEIMRLNLVEEDLPSMYADALRDATKYLKDATK